MVFFSLLPYTTIFDAIARALTERRTLLDRMQNAPFGEAHTQSAVFRDVARPECAFWSRRGGVAGAECAFP